MVWRGGQSCALQQDSELYLNRARHADVRCLYLAAEFVDGEDSHNSGDHKDDADDDRGEEGGVLAHAQAAKDDWRVEHHTVDACAHTGGSHHAWLVYCWSKNEKQALCEVQTGNMTVRFDTNDPRQEKL